MKVHGTGGTKQKIYVTHLSLLNTQLERVKNEEVKLILHCDLLPRSKYVSGEL